ncbi:conserved hypothetical protein [Candidatus Desulfosporosinus infrequens]|uniref:Uncharacterized protein n=1 Tax=Candidatus Desulfosporosinus infrequens TaxID=2043169 RepID=A0A2U3L9K5_9FIRM|nr:conserved hypothetical protein [Candidatus Desulfosporosinus infrequens]
MSIAAMNPFLGELIQTNVTGVTCNWIQRADYQISPVATSNTAVLVLTTLTSLVQTITTGITNPDVVRNVVAKGAIVTSIGNVIVTGTDYAGAVLSETIALSGTNVVAGLKAFATVTQIALPISSGAGDGVSVGLGSKLGLPYTLTKNTIGKAYNNNVLEATNPTVTVDAINICNNTVTLATTLAGNVVDICLDIPG